MTGDRAESYRVVIIGAGPGGLCMGAKLRDAGVTDFLIVERADGVGGTWRHNTYPGAACDIASHLYSFSFAPKYDWTCSYANQPEILEYFERFAAEHDLTDRTRLGVEVQQALWDDERSLWRTETSAGPLEAQVLVSAVGMFSDLNWPDLPGLDSFEGTVFHSARWDHDHDLSGEAVAVIGSGASAVQFVPEIAPLVGRLYHFQRQPQWVLPKADEAYGAETLARFRVDPSEPLRLRQETFDRVNTTMTFADAESRRLAEEAGRENLAVVRDPDTRRKLTPVAPWGCHRPLMSNVYYPTFNLPHVEVVTDPIAKVTASAVVTAKGTERGVDTIILGTGFATTKYLAVIDVVGRGGARLAERWAPGAEAYLGMSVSGFPNLFMLYGPNTNNGSILHMLECQVGYIVRQVQRLEAEQLASVEVRPEAMAAYNEALQRDLDAVEVWQAGCHGYYRGANGRIVTQWPHSMTEYTARTARPDPEVYEARALRPGDRRGL